MQRKAVAKCEIVRVDSPNFLINSDHEALQYETADGKQLSPGYYVALWPAGSCQSAHGRELLYLGPFVTMAIATMLNKSIQYLGIIIPETEAMTTPRNESRRHA